MTCVDAAIIKALVEHIGGNPDDVVVGGGSDSSKLNATWSTGTLPDSSDTVPTFTLPEGENIQLLTCLTLYSKDRLKNEHLYCCRIRQEQGTYQYDFTRIDSELDDYISIGYMDGIYYCVNGFETKYDTPTNNINAEEGFHNLSTVEMLKRLMLQHLRTTYTTH